MMVRVEKIKAEDLLLLDEKKAKVFYGSPLTYEQAKAMESVEHAYTVFKDEKILACAGVIEYWKNRGEAWAIINPEHKSDFLTLHKVVKRFFEICPIVRIEASVDVTFIQGNRWVQTLGFNLEATNLRKFLPNGNSAHLYSRVRD